MKMDECTSAEANSSEFALRVALQTMTERCKTLQNRLNIIEDECIEFRNNQKNKENTFYNDGVNVVDIDTKQNNKLLIDELKKKINDLEQQKIKLNDHIGMVSNENRQLWSRLSELSKERIINLSTNNSGRLVKPTSATDKNKIIIDIFGNKTDLGNCTGTVSVANEKNLVRSKTFTQHAPNPNLRYKNIDINETSLEEINLHNLINNENFKTDNASDNIGFSYFNNMSTDEFNNDVILDTKNCIDGILAFKRQQLQQQNNLTKLFNEIKKRIAFEECSKCNLIKISKPETAEKSSETDDSLTDEIPTDESQINLNVDESVHIDFIKEKILADESDKTCPMCGKVFGSQISFDSFRDHVEDHFVGTNTDEHLEFVSHIVGDF